VTGFGKYADFSNPATFMFWTREEWGRVHRALEWEGMRVPEAREQCQRLAGDVLQIIRHIKPVERRLEDERRNTQ
jgi:hypothetical protein